MSERLENKFSIKRVTKTSDTEYVKALYIYNETTPNDIRTSTNEITFWLNKNKDKNPFELLVFILYLDDSIVGLAMLSYIQSQRIVVYDYLALIEKYRVNTVFFPFINLLQNYISSNGYDVAYYVVEISNKNNGKSIDKESILFKKLICLEGFGMVHAVYYTLPLGVNNHESSFEAFIYLKSNDEINQISKETFLSIVKSIYYEYYLTWYSPLLVSDDLVQYKQKIDICYNTVIKQTSNTLNFEITHIECPILEDVKNEKTFGYLPSQKKHKIHIYPMVLLTLFVSPIMIIWGYNFILQRLDIPLSSVNSTIGGIFGAGVSSITAFLIAKNKL